MTGLSVSDVVNVQVYMTPIAAAVRNFGILLVVGDSTEIDVGERIRTYTGADQVAADFGTSAPEYQAAVLYFGQSPKPQQLSIGRWASGATNGLLHGGPLNAQDQNLVNFTNVTNGGFTINVDGTPQIITGLNFSTATNLNGVATLITAKLQAGAVCVWDSVYSRFDIISGTTGTNSVVNFATAPGSGTDVRALLKIASGQGGRTVAGIAAESLASAVAYMANKSTNWYGLQTVSINPSTIQDADVLAVAAFIEAQTVTRIYGVTSQDASMLDATNTTSIGYQLAQLGYQRTFTQYSSYNRFAAASIFGRAFTVDFNGFDTTITLKFKQEPGVPAEDLLETEARALQAINVNVFVKYDNDTMILQEGTMANGFFFDEVHGLDWLQNDVQTEVYNTLYKAPKVKQTEPGVTRLATAVARSNNRGVNNGLIAPGIWTGPSIGALEEGDMMETGWYVYTNPLANQSQADREARKAPPIQDMVKLAGAIHFADVIINVNR